MCWKIDVDVSSQVKGNVVIMIKMRFITTKNKWDIQIPLACNTQLHFKVVSPVHGVTVFY